MMNVSIINGQLTENFNIKEFCHSGADGLEINFDERFFDFVIALQVFRDWYKRPINITSGYRPDDYNKAVGGSKNSSHLKSLAVDFNLPSEFFGFPDIRAHEFYSNVLQKWSEICSEMGYWWQCNWYDTYVHLGFSLSNKNSFLDERRDKFYG